MCSDYKIMVHERAGVDYDAILNRNENLFAKRVTNNVKNMSRACW